VRKWIAIASALLAGLIATAVAYGATTGQVEIKPHPAKASTKKKVRPITLEINVTIADPAATQPSPLKKTVILFNKGGVFNGKLFPKCSAAKLEANGVKGCPKKSIIGKGTASASAKPIIDLVNAKVTVLNGPPKGGVPTVILYNVPDISSPIIVSGTVEKKSPQPCGGGGTCDYVLTFDVPDIPTLPNAPPASVLTVKTKTLPVFIKKKKRIHGRKRKVKIPLIGAPKKCKGKWYGEGQFTFASGEKNTSQVTIPCKK
jgi:hypothetical protein